MLWSLPQPLRARRFDRSGSHRRPCSGSQKSSRLDTEIAHANIHQRLISSGRLLIEANLGGSGDNRNGLLLGQIESRGILQGGTVSINDNYGRLIADVGSTASQIQANLRAQNVILVNIEDTISSKSGVNLDEEAARLIQFQQAYQAMAQVVAIANTLFDALLASVRR